MNPLVDSKTTLTVRDMDNKTLIVVDIDDAGYATIEDSRDTQILGAQLSRLLKALAKEIDLHVEDRTATTLPFVLETTA